MVIAKKSSANRCGGGGSRSTSAQIFPTRGRRADDDASVDARPIPGVVSAPRVEKSLRRLGVDRFDLLQLHSWMGDGVRSLDWFETLNELRIEGKIDQIGVSLRDYRPEEGVDLARLGLVSSLQVVFNLFDQRPAGALFEAAADSPEPPASPESRLDSGSLTGTWTPDTYSTWAPGSVPHSLFHGHRFAETLPSGRGPQKSSESLLHQPRRSRDAVCVEFTSGRHRHSRHEEPRRGRPQHRLLRRCSISLPSSSSELAAHNWPRNYYKEMTAAAVD